MWRGALAFLPPRQESGQRPASGIPLPVVLHLVEATYPKTDKLGNDPCAMCCRDLTWLKSRHQ